MVGEERRGEVGNDDDCLLVWAVLTCLSSPGQDDITASIYTLSLSHITDTPHSQHHHSHVRSGVSLLVKCKISFSFIRYYIAFSRGILCFHRSRDD